MELHIRDVSQTYPNGVQALKDVTLTIPAGIYGLLGPNGAGKSTLMRMIATLREQDTSTITLGEIDVVRQKDELRRMADIRDRHGNADSGGRRAIKFRGGAVPANHPRVTALANRSKHRAARPAV